jgi:hypothetical protein
VAFAGRSNAAATDALNYIFMAVYLVTILSYLTSSRYLLTGLQLLGFLLVFVDFIVAWATARGHFLRSTPWAPADSSPAGKG